MAVKVVLTNRSQEVGNLTSSGQDTKVRISRIVYQGLRSLAKNKIILDDYDNGKLPKELMDLYDKFAALTNGTNTEIEIETLDEYLGGLGKIQEYHYKKDIISIPPWIDVKEPSEYRNVITHLTDINGNEQNVIASISGQDYNIIHRT